MKVVSFENINYQDWDLVYSRSPDAWLFHSSDWINIEDTFFTSRNLSFAVYNGDSIIAIYPLYLSLGDKGTFAGETLIHSGIHRHTGLALDTKVSLSDINEVQSCAMRYIFDAASKYNAERIQLNKINLAPNIRDKSSAIPFWVREYGFQLGLGFGPMGMMPIPGFSTLNADMVIDTLQNEDMLWSQLDSACRRAIRKANKAGLSIKFTEDSNALESYYELAKRSADRTKELLPSKKYYETIFEKFLSNDRVMVALVSHESKDIAALLLFADKGGVSYLSGVSDSQFLSLRPNDFIHWNAILETKHRGMHSYRFGPVFPEVPREWPIAKVSSFKKKFGGTPIPVIQGSFFIKPDMYISQLNNHIEILSQIGSST